MSKTKATSHKRISRIEKAIDEVLKGEQADPLLKLLNKEDQAMLQEALRELRKDPGMASAYMSDLWRLDYTKRPPSMQDFIEDPYWLGGIMNKSEESEGLFPKWKEVLVHDFDIDSRIHNLVVTGSLGIGKCLKKDTLVRMANGSIRPVQDISAGDQIMGDDGTPRSIVSLARGQERMFDIEPFRPKKGVTWGCNASHLLTLKHPTSRELVEVTAQEVWDNQKRYSCYRLVRRGFELPVQPVPIDPYWLGLWLGDGLTHCAGLVVADEDHEILSYHKKFCSQFQGMEMSVWKEDSRGNACRVYNPTFKGLWHENPIVNALRGLGIPVKLRDNGGRKFIPEVYARNSADVRKQLLAGLIDTDGGTAYGCYDIALADRDLVLQIQDIAWSLGASCAMTKKIIVNKKFKTPATAWRLLISGVDLPTRLARRALKRTTTNRRNGGNRRSTGVTGFRIKDRGMGDYYGFELSGTNRRFLLADGTITHNTFVTVTILLYRIVLALLLRNPQAFFGLAKGSQIFYAILSVTRSVVQETAFGDVLNFMGNSPFFVEECHFNPNKKYANLRIPLGGNIFMTAGSQGWHIIGRNAMGVALDEGNFRLESNPDMKAYKLYDEVRTRIRNRFQKMAGFMPAISILSSSARDESSFTEKVVNDIEKSGDEDQKVYRFAVYKIKAHTLKLDKRWFKVSYGLKNIDPYILGGWYDKDGNPVGEDPHEQAPSGSKTELVPGNYHADFKRNVKTNLQSISGISTGGSFRFFGNAIDLEKAVTLGTSNGLANPCTVVSIPLSEEDDHEIWDFLDAKTFLTKKLSQIMPKRDPGAYRYCHLDLATRTQAGMSICHIVGKQKVEGLINMGGEVFDEYRVVVEYDFILSIIAGKQKPISINKVIHFLYWLRDICGFRFAVVTADSFQCLSGDTLVNTSRGLIELRDVAVGDVVQSKLGPRPVECVVSYPNAPVLEVELDDGEILTGTPNHKIESCRYEVAPWSGWKPKFDWVRLDKLNVGDVVSTVNAKCVGPTDYVPLDRFEHSIGKHCALHAPNVGEFNPLILNETFAEWVGIVWGDGYISRNHVSVAAHRDELEDVVSCFKRQKFDPVIKPCHGHFNVRVQSHQLVLWLASFGLVKPGIKKTGGFTGEIGIPDCILRSPRSVVGAFIRGLFSADGCVTGQQITFVTKHLKMARQLQTLLRTYFGIPTHICKRTVRSAFGRTYDPPCVNYIMSVRGERSKFVEIGFCYAKKQRKLQSIAHIKGRRLYSKIKSIKEVSARDVFDIRVKDDPSYTANGIVSHNSALPLQMLEKQRFKVANLSVDKTKKPYEAWRAGFEEARIRMFAQSILMNEAENLVDTGDKVDHDDNHTKDVCDGACGAYFSAVTFKDDNTMRSPHGNMPGVYSNVDLNSEESPPVTVVDLEKHRKPSRSFDA